MRRFYLKGEFKPVNKILFTGLSNPDELYSALLGAWSKETCAPRMAQRWSEDNKTLGQCSVTAFLAQDIFGGEVYGIPLGDGNFHLFNKVGDCIFDLTCEQFEGKTLDYSLSYPQIRETHFAKEEKYNRYKLLKKKLNI